MEMDTQRVFEVVARTGDPLPERDPTENDRRYYARVMRWAIPSLTQEDADKAMSTIQRGDLLPKSIRAAATLLQRAFPGCDVRRAQR